MSGPLVIDLLSRVGPVVLFLVAITVVAEVAQLAGVFDAAAGHATRLARGSVLRLWTLVAVLAVACTVVLGLDTTAVLLTPAVLSACRRAGVAALPFALTTVWLANTASLLLPVSNLTNLLALDRLGALGMGTWDHVRLLWRPAVAAVVATLAVVLVLFRGRLRGRFTVPAAPAASDRVLLVVASTVCLLLAPALVSGPTPALPASAAAGALLVVLALRRPELVREVQVPWAGAAGVCLVLGAVEVAAAHGLTGLLAGPAGTGSGTGDLARLTAVAAAGSNAVNNLPAYLALEPLAAGDPRRLAALLIGADVGPLVTPWASLATVLWLDRCRRAGLTVALRPYVARSLVCAVVAVVAAWAALVV